MSFFGGGERFRVNVFDVLMGGGHQHMRWRWKEAPEAIGG